MKTLALAAALVALAGCSPPEVRRMEPTALPDRVITVDDQGRPTGLPGEPAMCAALRHLATVEESRLPPHASAEDARQTRCARSAVEAYCTGVPVAANNCGGK